MVFTILVFANRKPSITHQEFKTRYEQHMLMVADLCGDAMPLSHTRFYTKYDRLTNRPDLLAGNAVQELYDVVVAMEFQDEAAWGKFCAVLSTESASKKIMDDEAGFWERQGMKVVAAERCQSQR